MSPRTPTPVMRHEGVTPALTNEESLLRLAIEHGADAIFVLDLATEECVFVSPAVRSLLGREPRELAGRSLIEFVHPADAAEVLARSLLRRQGRGARTAVSRMLHSDGRWIWVQATASAPVDHCGRTLTVFTVAYAAERVRAELGLRASRVHLRRLVAQVGGDDGYLRTKDGNYDLAVEALAAALELRDDETCQHARRVTELALELTRAIDPVLAAEPELRYAYLLHDIGKIGIPDAILQKPTPLSDQEMTTMRMHTALGEHLLSFIPLLSDLAHDVIAYHHEYWDGTGYPWGLSGAEIPLAARIFAVADAYDGITNDRPYRRARTAAEALVEIERSSGSQFDPAVVEVCLRILRARAGRPAAQRSARAGRGSPAVRVSREGWA
jgi:PAS domain S-box-containing protein